MRSEDDLQDWRLQLVDADLKGMPPVTLITARIDPLRSEGALPGWQSMRPDRRAAGRTALCSFARAALIAR